MNTLFDMDTIDTNVKTVKLCSEGTEKLRQARNFLLDHPELFDSAFAPNGEVMTVAVKLDNMMARLRVTDAGAEAK